MNFETEKDLEDKSIQELTKLNYEFININTIKDLKTNFKKQLEKFNHTKISKSEFKEVLTYINKGSIFEKYIKLHETYTINSNKKINFISTDYTQNIFQISNQIKMKKKYNNRYDITILINGLPLVQIELKKRGEPIIEAFNQIERYKIQSYNDLFDYIQVFIISNGASTKYFSNGNIKDFNFNKTIYWMDEQDNLISSLKSFIKSFLNPDNLTNFLNKYIICDKKKSKLYALRPYQIKSINKVNNQIRKGKNGYIWYTYGAGKSLTSYKLAELLSSDFKDKKLVFLTNLNNLNKYPGNKIANNTKTFLNKLKKDENLIITTPKTVYNAIQNDDNQYLIDEEFIFIYNEINWINFKNNPKILMDFFKNSLFYGFTGTPYFNKNNNHEITSKSIFNNLLNTYLLTDALKDHNLLNIVIDYYDSGSDYGSSERINEICKLILKDYKDKTFNKKFNSILILDNNTLIPKYYSRLKKTDLNIATLLKFKNNDSLVNNKHFRDYYEEYLKDYNKKYKTKIDSKKHTTIDNVRKIYEEDLFEKLRQGKIDLLITDKTCIKDNEYYNTNYSLKQCKNSLNNTIYADTDLNCEEVQDLISFINQIIENKKYGNLIFFNNIKETVDKSLKYYNNKHKDDKQLKHYNEYIKTCNKIIMELKELILQPEDIFKLKTLKDKEQFINNFKKLEYTIHVLENYYKFTYEDLKISHDQFNDYKGIYNLLKSEIKSNLPNKTDTKIELIQTDTVNYEYLINLKDPEYLNKFKVNLQGEDFFKLYNENEDNNDLIDLKTFIRIYGEDFKICSKCKNLYPNGTDVNYCPNGCGELINLKKYLEKNDLNTKYCPICNETYNSDDIYCDTCGVKLKNKKDNI